MIRVPGAIKDAVPAPLPLLAKTSLCTLMWFTNKCTYLKHNSPRLAYGCFETSGLRGAQYIQREAH